jgi:hypothetical protein
VVVYLTALAVYSGARTIEKDWLKFCAGFSLCVGLWSIVYPSPAERFSTTLNDAQTMVTRAFFLAIGSLPLVFVDNEWVCLTCTGLIALFPLWFWIGLIGQFTTVLWWAVEVVLRYGLGMAGLVCIDKTFCASVVLYGVYTVIVWQNVDSIAVMVPLFGVSVFVLNITWSNRGLILATIVAGISTLAFGISIGFLVGSSKWIELADAIVCVIFFFLAPMACGPSSPYLGCVYFLKPSLVLSIVNLVVSSIFPALIVGAIWIEIEFGPSSNQAFSYLLSLVIAKKLFSMMPFFEFVSHAPRRSGFDRDDFLKFWFLSHTPLFGCPLSFSIGCGLITGSPAYLFPSRVGCFHPASPRSNTF